MGPVTESTDIRKNFNSLQKRKSTSSLKVFIVMLSYSGSTKVLKDKLVCIPVNNYNCIQEKQIRCF